MGKVYTTSEDLTSVANAIRAKSGSNSSLIYPSGFVSEIGNISTGSNDVYDGIGKNPTFMQTIWSENITLADTDWDSSTVPNAEKTIRDYTSIVSNSNNRIPLNWDYDYFIKMEGQINLVYTEAVYPAVLTSYTTTGYIAIPYFSELTTIATNGSKTVNSKQILSLNATIYKDSNNQIKTFYATCGIYYHLYYGATFNINSGVFALYTPTIRCQLSTNYFPQTAIDAIDKNNTTLNYTMKLYRYDKGSIYLNYNYNRLYESFLTDYPQYAPQS